MISIGVEVDLPFPNADDDGDGMLNDHAYRIQVNPKKIERKIPATRMRW